jgi:hypothetical protein
MSDRSTNRAVLTALLARVTEPGLRAAADVAGLAALVAAAWLWHAGLAALGVALLVLAARAGDRG